VSSEGGLPLRTEATTNDVRDYSVNKAVENLPQWKGKMASIKHNYLNMQQDILESFLNGGQMRKLSEPTVLPKADAFPASNWISNWL